MLHDAMLLVAQMRWHDAEETLRSLLHRAEAGFGFTHEATLQALSLPAAHRPTPSPTPLRPCPTTVCSMNARSYI